MAEQTGKPIIGPTGEFPEGKLGEHDEGELQFAITHQRGQVVLSFNTPVAWVGMDPDKADALAHLLRRHASLIRSGF